MLTQMPVPCEEAPELPWLVHSSPTQVHLPISSVNPSVPVTGPHLVGTSLPSAVGSTPSGGFPPSPVQWRPHLVGISHPSAVASPKLKGDGRGAGGTFLIPIGRKLCLEIQGTPWQMAEVTTVWVKTIHPLHITWIEPRARHIREKLSTPELQP